MARLGGAGRVARLLPVVSRRGWRDGVQGGSTLWLALGAASTAWRIIRWLNGRDRSEHLLTETLQPGDALLISDGGEPVIVRGATPPRA